MLRSLPVRLALAISAAFLLCLVGLLWSLPRIEATGADEGLAVAIAAGLALVAATALALIVSWRVARPLEELREAVAAFSRGELHRRAAVGGGVEVSQLARTFNEMAARVGGAMTLQAEARSRLEALLSSSANGVIALDAAGVVQYVNPAMLRLLGEAPPSPGRTLLEWTRDHDLSRLFRRSLAERAPQGEILSLQRGALWVQATFLPITGGGAWATLGVLYDLSEIRRAETSRRDFVANVSHELRTPLASIKAVVETLRDGAIADPAVADDFLASVDAEVDRLVQLVNELLELARIESGAALTAQEPIAVADLIDSCIDRFTLQAERAGVRLERGETPADLVVRGDLTRLDRALGNLLHNALKFTPAGGRVRVQGEREAGQAVIEVRDTGIGIEPHEQGRIFERFYMADRARGGKGTGLGLAIVKHVARAHGGEVGVRSEPGRGSTFTIRLPEAATSEG